jgi:hypothetical protein
MDEILTKLFNKWFRYKIKKEWAEKIQAEKYTEEQEERLAKEIVSAVDDSINDILGRIDEELNNTYWLVDTTIQDTMDQIEEEEREKKEKLQQDQEEKDEPWITDDTDLKEGDVVICSFEDREKCACIHNKPHLYDPSSCSFGCAYDDENSQHKRVKCVETDEEIEKEEEPDDHMKEILSTGGV